MVLWHTRPKIPNAIWIESAICKVSTIYTYITSEETDGPTEQRQNSTGTNMPLTLYVRHSLTRKHFYHSVYAMGLSFVSVCSSLSVTCSSVSKWLNVGWCKQSHTIVQESILTKVLVKITWGHNGGTKCRWGKLKLVTFDKLITLLRWCETDT